MIASNLLARRRSVAWAVAIVATLAGAGCDSATTVNPVVNGDMEQWSGGADGNPGAWRIAAGSGHFEQSGRLKHSGHSSAKVVLAGPNATVLQSVPVGLPANSLMSCSAWVNASHTKVRIHVTDGRSSARSPWHPSDGRWYQLTARMPSGESAADVAVDISASSIRSLDDFAWATFIDDVECHAVQTTFAKRTSLWFADLWDSAWLNVGNYWTFRSESGGWAYPLIRTFDLHALSVFVEAAAVAVLMVWLTDGPLRLPIWFSIVVWLSGSWIVQRTIGQLAPDRLGSLIESDTANAFYTPTLRYSWREFLDQHLTLPLARHARTNMPGKVMFFYPLQSLTGSTQAMAYIVMLLSNIGGGLLAFAIAKKLFKDNRAALYSMAFYLLIPGKICFFPLLNTLTPVFVLLSLYLWLLYLESRRSWYLAGLGASLYWLLLFDPIPFCLGFVFVAFLIAAWRQQRFTMTDLLILTGVVGGAFLAVHFVALFAIRYNIFSDFAAVARVNSEFNEERPYGIWVYGNLWEFLMSAGIVQSAIVLSLAALVLKKLATAHSAAERISIVSQPAHVLLLSYLASVIVLDLVGLNRGEVMRMWTFLTVFMAMLAAYVCALKLPKAVTYLIAIVTVFQATATIYTVGIALH